MKNTRQLIAGALLVALAGCTSGQSALQPKVVSVDPIASNRLQFAVGTVNIGGTVGLNTVVTLRQSNGLSGLLLDTPTITGPAGFVVPTVTAAGVDAGTSSISGSLQPIAGVAAPASTFGTTGGAFGYGFQPNNSNTGGAPSFTRYLLPFYAPAAITTARYIGGPPAFPQVRDGTFPSGFQGYPFGFTDFMAAPVTGTYSLSVVVPTGFRSDGTPTTGTMTATANLSTTTPLPAFAAPTFTPDGVGGGTIGVTVPAGVSEAYVVIIDSTGGCYPGTQSAPAYYTVRTTTTGAQTLTLPSNLGPTGPGFTNTLSICHGDSYKVYAVGFNYGANAAAYPFSTSATPSITGANGQADITRSPVAAASSIYP